MNHTAIFNGVYRAMVEARAQIRFSERDVVEEALCSGIEQARQNTEQGQYLSSIPSVRYLAADEPDQGAEIGKAVEVLPTGETEWARLRIIGRLHTSGVVRLTLEAVNA